MQKIIKLLFAVCVLFVCTCTFAQENKPTKDETIAWLKEKLPDFLEKKELFLSECEMTIIDYQVNGDVLWTKTCPLTALINYEEEEKDGGWVWKGLNFPGGKTVWYNGVTFNNGSVFLKFVTPEMGKRIEEAFKYLATFCMK